MSVPSLSVTRSALSTKQHVPRPCNFGHAHVPVELSGAGTLIRRCVCVCNHNNNNNINKKYTASLHQRMPVTNEHTDTFAQANKQI